MGYGFCTELWVFLLFIFVLLGWGSSALSGYILEEMAAIPLCLSPPVHQVLALLFVRTAPWVFLICVVFADTVHRRNPHVKMPVGYTNEPD